MLSLRHIPIDIINQIISNVQDSINVNGAFFDVILKLWIYVKMQLNKSKNVSPDSNVAD